MRIVARPCQGGKTTELVEWVMQDPENRGLIVRNGDARQWVLRRFNPPPNTVYTLEEVRGMRLRGRPKRAWAVDDIDALLIDVLRVLVEVVALTGETVAPHGLLREEKLVCETTPGGVLDGAKRHLFLAPPDVYRLNPDGDPVLVEGPLSVLKIRGKERPEEGHINDALVYMDEICGEMTLEQAIKESGFSNRAQVGVFKKGWQARHEGVCMSLNPYKDLRTYRGSITWSRTYIYAWDEGWQAAKKSAGVDNA